MKEAITSRHGKNTPATCNKNHHQIPINRLWVSRDLHITASGYLSFGEGPKSDHRVLWADITKASALGVFDWATPAPSFRKLDCRDPHRIKRYNRHTLKMLADTKVFTKMNNLIETAQKDGWSPQLQQQFDQIDILQVRIQKGAEKKIRKI